MKNKGNGLKLIAVGIFLTHEGRKRKIELLNKEIDSVVDAMRSSSDIDGLPHGTTVGDPVSSRVEKKEKLERTRDLEQKFVSAVEWAYSYVSDMFDDKDAPYLREAIKKYIEKDQNGAMRLIREKTMIAPSAFYRARCIFLKQIIKYLYLEQETGGRK